MTDTVNSDGTRTSASWGCCGKESETDASGITQIYHHDDLQRVNSVIKDGVSAGEFPAQSATATDYALDALGRTLMVTNSGGAVLFLSPPTSMTAPGG